MTVKPSNSNLDIDVLYSHASMAFCKALVEDNYEQIEELKNWSEIFMCQFARKGWKLEKSRHILRTQDASWFQK